MYKDNINLIIAVALSILIIVGWQLLYERPKLSKASYQENHQINTTKINIAEDTNISRNAAIMNSNRVYIKTSRLTGSVNLQGLRFDDLLLSNYKQSIDLNSNNIELLSPSNTQNGYFLELGLLSSDTEVPSAATIWECDKDVITSGEVATFTWINNKNIKFTVNISVDENYLFTITQKVFNNSNNPITTQSYGLINRNYTNEEIKKNSTIVHQGAIAVLNKSLKEYTYESINEKKEEQLFDQQINWLGITDKYWLTAFIPDQNMKYSVNLRSIIINGYNKYQIDFIGDKQSVAANSELVLTYKLFAGAKEVTLLDKYEKDDSIYLFDRTIDFGWFYIFTKPIFKILTFFYKLCGNFGISIMIVTVLIKALLFSLTSKSFKTMKRLKDLQPQIDNIKNLYKNDSAKTHQEIMNLYKKEKVNPFSGCLPILIQIPIFFSIYKVLNVTIEMRQAHFFGWIKDLSVEDPSNVFNLFGLINWQPPVILHLGVWPLLMSFTMYLQQKMSPPPTDPMQAQMMKFLPLIFLFMFNNFPSGLLIYWTWSNILSIAQQYFTNRTTK